MVRPKTGLAVLIFINDRYYETKKTPLPSFEQEYRKHITHDNVIPRWNYLVTSS